MATSFADIYKQFRSKAKDYEILQFSVPEREEVLYPYLKSAQVYFGSRCKIDLSDKDEIEMQYNNDLDEDIIDILATGMLYYWLLPHINNTDLLTLNFSTKEITFTSPANMIKELRSLRSDVFAEFKNRISMYSYQQGDIANIYNNL